MGKLRIGDFAAAQGSNSNAVNCGKCGESFERIGAYKAGDVTHCDGLSWAFGSRLRDDPHHAPTLHPRCWACGANLGCERCSGTISELLCGNTKLHGRLGFVWAAREGLIEHGINGRCQTIDDYPPEWRQAYMQTADSVSCGVRSLDALVRQVAG